MKSCKSVQETSEEVLFIKSRHNHIYRGLMLKLNRISTAAVFVKIYEIRISRYDFMHIHEYLCRVSFLTTLYIYMDYFKGRHMDATWCKVIIHVYCDRRQFCHSSSYSLEATTSLHQGFCDQGASWSSLLDELKNFTTNIFLKLVCSSRTGIRASLVSHV